MKGSPLNPLPELSPVFHKVGVEAMNDDWRRREDVPNSVGRPTQSGAPKRSGPAALLACVRESVIGLTSKGFKHSNTGSAAKSTRELPYFCPLGDERADAEAKEIISQTTFWR